MLYATMVGANSVTPVSIVDTGGAARTIYYTNPVVNGGVYHFDVLAGAASVLFGIIIGTGVTAPDITDDSIETLIAHATMNYGAVTFGLPSSDATTSQLTITRNFSNVSGGAVVVNEIALYCRGYDGAARYFCIIHDVIGGGISVPNGQTLTVNYRPQAVV